MSGDSFTEATISGVRWVTLARVVSETLQLASFVVLARLLSPAQFGHAAVALIFVPLAGILTFEGFASALVQRERIDERHREVATMMSLVGGATLTLTVLALVPFAWRPIFGAETAHLIALVSPVFVLASVGTVPRATLWRRLDFKTMSLIDVAATATAVIVPPILAIAGLRASAIIIGALAAAFVTSALLFVAAPFPTPRWHGGAQRDIGGFGLAAALAGLVDVLFRNVDYGILASQLTAAQTGIYWRAFNLGVGYQDKVSTVMMSLAFPVYSRTSGAAHLRDLHERATRVHAAVIFPLLASFITLAPTLIPFVLGSAWTPAVRPAQILALAGMIAAVLTGYPQVMLAVGRPQALLKFNLAMLVVYAGAVWLAVHHGLIAIAVVVTVVYVLILVGVYRLLLQRYVAIAVSRLLPELAPAAIGCLALVAVGEPVRLALVSVVPAPLTIGVAGLAGLLAYGVALRLVSPSTWSDLTGLAVRVVPALGRLPRSVGRAGQAASASYAPTGGS